MFLLLLVSLAKKPPVAPSDVIQLTDAENVNITMGATQAALKLNFWKR